MTGGHLRWRALLLTAKALAGEEGPIDAAPLADFNHDLIAAGRWAFPVEGGSIQCAVEAFLRLGRAFVVAGLPELREAYGPALSAAADCLEDILDLQRVEMAQAGRAVMGERE